MNGLEKFGAQSADEIALRESSSALENDIRAVPGLAELVKDDCMAFHVGQAMVNSIVRSLYRPEFLYASTGEIGQLLSNLRGKSENYMFFMFLRGCDRSSLSVNPNEFFRSAGWEVLSDADHILFDKAWTTYGSKWVG